MIEKRKQGKAGKRMGISHEYHSTHGRRRHSKAGTGLRLAGIIAAILLLSLAITAILENGEKQSEAVQQSPAAGTAANILAPLPMQGDTGASAQTAPAVRQGKAVEPTMRRLSRWNSSAPPGRQRGPTRSRRMTAV